MKTKTLTGAEMTDMFTQAERAADAAVKADELATGGSNTFGLKLRVLGGIDAYLEGVEGAAVDYFERANGAAMGGNHAEEQRWNYMAKAYEAGRKGRRFNF